MEAELGLRIISRQGSCREPFHVLGFYLSLWFFFKFVLSALRRSRESPLMSKRIHLCAQCWVSCCLWFHFFFPLNLRNWDVLSLSWKASNWGCLWRLTGNLAYGVYFIEDTHYLCLWQANLTSVVKCLKKKKWLWKNLKGSRSCQHRCHNSCMCSM